MAVSVRTIRDLYRNPQRCARYLRLRYVQDFTRGFRQEKRGRGLRFAHPNGKPVTDSVKIELLKSLRIPPAWQEVWICPTDRGHILAVGTDDAGRKQYRYHPRWSQFRTLLNTYRLIPFGYALSSIRAKTKTLTGAEDVTPETTLLAAIRLLDNTWIRIGMPTEETDAVGLLTLEEENVEVRRDSTTLAFTGKSGQDQELEVRDKPLAQFLAALVETGDDELFSFNTEDGEVETLGAEELNGALRELGEDEDLSAKDFRTWGGTLTAFQWLAKHPERTKKGRESVVRDAVERAAEELGNTPAVARKSYIHPHLLESYHDGRLVSDVSRFRIRKPIPHLHKDEQYLLKYLEQLLAEQVAIT